MDIVLGLLLFALGVALLDRGADWFTDSAVDFARVARLPLVLVGLLTVGIEWEELAVVIVALIGGNEGLAFGALIGSAIANMTIVVALGAAVREVRAGAVEQTLSVLLLIGTVLLVALGSLGDIGRSDGIVLLGGFVVYLIWLGRAFVSGRADELLDDEDEDNASEPEASDDDAEELLRGWLIAAIVGALAVTLLGGELAVRGALRVAEHTPLTQTTAGLTLVALGTSLPDALVSFRAARRGATPLVLANAAGSNLCNLLLLTGILALFGSVAVPGSVQRIDLPVLLAVTAALTIMLARGSLGRGYAIAMTVVYVGFVLVRMM